jgi:hypothetical protein
MEGQTPSASNFAHLLGEDKWRGKNDFNRRI